jgi:hypothetical protein
MPRSSRWKTGLLLIGAVMAVAVATIAVRLSRPLTPLVLMTGYKDLPFYPSLDDRWWNTGSDCLIEGPLPNYIEITARCKEQLSKEVDHMLPPGNGAQYGIDQPKPYAPAAR